MLIILLRYHKLIIEERTKIIDYRTCISQLLNMTADENMIEESFLMYLRIQMSIAILYTNYGEYRHADAIYLSLLKDEYQTVEYKKIKLKILYNYIRNLIKQKDFTAILKETELAIDESNHLQDLSYLGHFYYQRGYALEQLESSIKFDSRILHTCLWNFSGDRKHFVRDYIRRSFNRSDVFFIEMSPETSCLTAVRKQ